MESARVGRGACERAVPYVRRGRRYAKFAPFLCAACAARQSDLNSNAWWKGKHRTSWLCSNGSELTGSHRPERCHQNQSDRGTVRIEDRLDLGRSSTSREPAFRESEETSQKSRADQRDSRGRELGCSLGTR